MNEALPIHGSANQKPERYRYNIRTDHSSDHESDEESLSDEEDSSGVQVSPASVNGSHGYPDSYDGDEWAHLSYPDELKSSEPASRPRPARRSRKPVHASRSQSNRRYSRRDIATDREPPSHRPRRHQSPPGSPESGDSTEEYPHYSRAPNDRRYWSSAAPGVVSGYANSSSSGPPYAGYPPTTIAHGAYPHAASSHTPSDQLIRFGHLGHPGRPAAFGNAAAFGYGHPFTSHNPPPFFGHEHHPGPAMPAHPNHPGSQSRNRSGRHSPPTAPPHANPPFGASPFGPSDMMPFGPNGYFPYNQLYPVMTGMGPPSMFGQLAPPPPPPPPPPQRTPTPSPAPPPPPPPPPPDTSKDDAIARLEKLILDERIEREAKEAARQAAIEKAAADKAAAEERAAADQRIADEAAIRATAMAKAVAEKKAAEDAVKAKKAADEATKEAAKMAAEEAAKIAAEEAAKMATEGAAKIAAEGAAANAAAAAAAAASAAAAAAAAPPPEKKKPIKFKDAVGRKFSFPFHLCCTWQVGIIQKPFITAWVHFDR
jgi:hypothetical protein